MQKIIPSLWFDNNTEDAINFYISVFSNNPSKANESKINNITHYEKGMEAPGTDQLEGKVITANFELEGQKFMALDGGPIFKINPSISFFINCKTDEEVEYFWHSFSDECNILMPLDKYEFSEKYGWLEDKFGISWQIIKSESSQKIVPSLLFTQNHAGQAEEAINFYTSIFKNSNIGSITRYPAGGPDKEGTVSYGEFTLENQKFIAMDSSLDHKFTFNEAVSFLVNCDDQKEVDLLWEKLSAVPESEQCGWLKDKFGISWQIIPERLGELMSASDHQKSTKVLNTMLKMKKIEVSKLEEAYNS